MKYYTLSLACLLSFFATFGQQKSHELVKLKKDALNLFYEEYYSEALPSFSQLLSLNPKDPELNYYFGVCLLYGDKRDSEKPLKYLEFAAKNKACEPEVYYYLGQAYHVNFRFTEAIRNYSRFLSMASTSKANRLVVSRNIEMCNNGLYLLSKVSDLFVLEKTEVQIDGFYKSYDHVDIAGKFLRKPDELMSRADKKSKNQDIVFYPANKDMLVFSGYGKDKSRGKDIFFSYRQPDGKWGSPLRLPETVNTVYDEDYPYLLPDGKTLYFSSKGHNSMGGYDIFRTVYDSITFQWSTPENLDFAINTPYDDVLFVPDRKQQYAYFASSRSTTDDKIMVYRVRIDRRPEKSAQTDLLSGIGKREMDTTQMLAVAKSLKKMADLQVNTSENAIGDDTAIAQTVVPNANDNPVADQDGAKSDIVSDSINFNIRASAMLARQSEATTITDSAFSLVDKSGQSLKQFKEVRNSVRRFSKNITRKSTKETSNSLANDLDRQINIREIKLEKWKNEAGRIQQLASTGKPDSARNVLNGMLSSISASDTTSDVIYWVQKELDHVVIDGANDGVLLSKTTVSQLKSDESDAGIISDAIENPDLAIAVVKKQEAEQVPETENKAITQSKPVLAIEKSKSVTQPKKEQPEPKTLVDTAAVVMENFDNRPTFIADSVPPEERMAMKFNTFNDSLKQIVNAINEEIIATVDLTNQKKFKQAKERSKDARDVVDLVALNEINAYLQNVKTEVQKKIDGLNVSSGEVSSVLASLDMTKADNFFEEKIKEISSVYENSTSKETIKQVINQKAAGYKQLAQPSLENSNSLIAKADILTEKAKELREEAASISNKKVSREFRNKAAELEEQAQQSRKEAVDQYNQFVLIDNKAKAILSSSARLDSLYAGINQKASLVKTGNVKLNKTDTTHISDGINDLLVNEIPKRNADFSQIISSSRKNFDPGPVISRAVQRDTLVKPVLANSVAEKIEADVTTFRNQYEVFLAKSKEPSRLEVINISPGMSLRRSLDSLDTQSRQAVVERDTLKQMLVESKLKLIADSLEAQVPENGESGSITLDVFEVRAAGHRARYLVNKVRIEKMIQDIPDLDMRHQVSQLSADADAEFVKASREESEITKSTSKSFKINRAIENLNHYQQVVAKQNQAIVRLNSSKPQEEPVRPESRVISQEEKVKPESKVVSQETPVKTESRVISQEEKVRPESGVIRQEEKVLPESKVVSQEEPVRPESRVVSQEEKVKPESKVVGQETPVRPDSGVVSQEEKVRPESGVVSQEGKVKPESKVISQETPVKTEQIAENTNGLFQQNQVEKQQNENGKNIDNVIVNEIQNSVKAGVFPKADVVYYTVQVGVFRTARNAAQVSDWYPAFTDRTQTGLFRYYSGIYGEFSDARKARDIIRGKGVADAFVVAFRGGVRVRFDQISDQKTPMLRTLISQEKLQQIVDSGKPRPGIYFGVQLIAYKREINQTDINYFKAKTKEPLRQEITSSGFHVIIAGNCKDYECALALKSALNKAGMADAFIIGYVNGERTTAANARELLKK